MPGDLVESVALALRRGGIHVTLQELLSELAPPSTLEGLERIRESIQRADLELIPGIEEGDLETERLLRPVLSPGDATAAMERELREGEGHCLEYKSSLLFDRRRARAEPLAPATDLRSEKVRDAALKAICGLLNSDGGVLLLGVADDGIVVGIEADFAYTGGQGTLAEQRDRWALHLGDCIRGRFHDGTHVARLVGPTFVDHGGLTVARVVVGKRKRLAVLKCDGGEAVFVRRGNRTERVEMHDLEELIRERVEAEARERS